MFQVLVVGVKQSQSAMMYDNTQRICMRSEKYLQSELRKKAEKISLLGPALNIEELKAMSTEEIVQKMHELDLHQVCQTNSKNGQLN